MNNQNDELSFTLNSHLTEEDWDVISDVDFDNTNEIALLTKHGKRVEFVKKQQWIPCSERLPERPEQMLVYAINTHFSIAKYKEVRKGVNDYIYTWVTDNAFDVPHEVKNVIAWMPLPEPYKR